MILMLWTSFFMLSHTTAKNMVNSAADDNTGKFRKQKLNTKSKKLSINQRCPEIRNQSFKIKFQ